MSRKKRTSRVLKKAELRAAGMKAINPNLDFGETRNLETMSQLIEELRHKLDVYNTALSTIDSYKSEIDDLEKSLNELSEKMLLGVAFEYGKDSREYEMAGGVRKSERIRKSRATRLKNDEDEPSEEIE